MGIERLDTEKDIEKYLRERVKQLGGIYRKVVYQGRKGAPDDWCFFPGGKLVIVECKGLGGRVDRQQAVEHEELGLKGFKVHVVYTRTEVERMFEEEGLIGDEFICEGSEQ